MSSKQLGEPLRTLLLMGVKQAGTFNPEDALLSIEEQLTNDDYITATPFLRWCHHNKKAFGHGNIDARFAEYLKEKEPIRTGKVVPLSEAQGRKKA